MAQSLLLTIFSVGCGLLAMVLVTCAHGADVLVAEAKGEGRPLLSWDSVFVRVGRLGRTGTFFTKEEIALVRPRFPRWKADDEDKP